MIDAKLVKTHLFSAFLDVIAKSKELEVVPATDSRLGHPPCCDVCGGHPRSGHLLQGTYGFAWQLPLNNARLPVTCSITSLGPGEERDAQFWVCGRCHKRLRGDRVALIREIVERL